VATRTAPDPNDPVAYFPTMQVGDKWTKEKNNKTYHLKIISVEKDGSFIAEKKFDAQNSLFHMYYNNELLLVKFKNIRTGKTTTKSKPLRRWISFPLFVGKKWETEYMGRSVGNTPYKYSDIYKVVKYETVETDVGSFKSFKVKRANYTEHGGPWITYYWYSPKVKDVVKVESIYQKESKLQKLLSYELVQFGETFQANKAPKTDIASKTSAQPTTETATIKKTPVKTKPAPANTPPQIILTEPIVSRGVNKTLSTKQKMLKVAGRAVDDGGIYQVVINGMEADLKQGGYFSADVPLAIGKNAVRVVALDNLKLSGEKKFYVNRLSTVKKAVVKEKRLALIMGNAEYTHGGSLDNPVNDVRSIASALKKLNFKVIREENTTQRSMKKAIDRFGQSLEGYDVGLFFYAGHGVQVNGVNYLVPVNANLNSQNDVEYDCVNAGRVLAEMEDAGSKTNIMILDACRDNPFERSWTRNAKGTGLAFMNAPSGSLIAYATSPGKTAADGSGKNGLYTQALLKNLSTPDITVLEMFQRVRVMVMKQSRDKQTPWESTSLRGNFYFKRK
jgi:hypothetical protein